MVLPKKKKRTHLVRHSVPLTSPLTINSSIEKEYKAVEYNVHATHAYQCLVCIFIYFEEKMKNEVRILAAN
jgi:hypothetical protein